MTNFVSDNNNDRDTNRLKYKSQGNKHDGQDKKEDQKQQMVDYWWEKAQSSFASAQREYKAQAYDFAINRLYYAAFYAVSALLLRENLSFKKHSGVRSYFHKNFIKTGKLKIRWGKFYDRLFEDRQESDYTAFTDFKQEYVKEQIDLCQKFLAEIESLLEFDN